MFKALKLRSFRPRGMLSFCIVKSLQTHRSHHHCLLLLSLSFLRRGGDGSRLIVVSAWTPPMLRLFHSLCPHCLELLYGFLIPLVQDKKTNNRPEEPGASKTNEEIVIPASQSNLRPHTTRLKGIEPSTQTNETGRARRCRQTLSTFCARNLGFFFSTIP